VSQPVNTVGELIAALSKYPADMPVLIYDADTDWELAVYVAPSEERYMEDGAVALYGEYHDDRKPR
jgi:hypothetical protein